MAKCQSRSREGWVPADSIFAGVSLQEEWSGKRLARGEDNRETEQASSSTSTSPSRRWASQRKNWHTYIIIRTYVKTLIDTPHEQANTVKRRNKSRSRHQTLGKHCSSILKQRQTWVNNEGLMTHPKTNAAKGWLAVEWWSRRQQLL